MYPLGKQFEIDYSKVPSKANLIYKNAFMKHDAERRIEFDHKKKRLFQVSDMLTVIDKLEYKRKNNGIWFE